MAKTKDVIDDALVKVELNGAKKGTHTVYHKLGVTTFEDGVAEVTSEVATELRDAGIVK